MRLSLRARVTLASAALLALILAATGVFLYVRLEADLMASVDESLRGLAAGLRPDIDRSGNVIDVDALLPAGVDEAVAQVLDPAETSPPDPDHPWLLSAAEVAGVGGTTFFERDLDVWGETEPSRILATPTDDGLVLVVAVPVDDQRDALARLASLLWIGGPLALALTVGVTWLLVGATLRPVDSMRAEAAAISASEPGRRLPVPNTGDEVARLGQTLNEMLDRLEQAHERERRFVDDASHELRTPLANLKAELDLALRRSRTVEELERALRSASEESDRLARLADDLLVLARADRGRLPVRRAPVDISRLVTGMVEAFAASAAGPRRRDRGASSRGPPSRRRRAPAPAGSREPARERAPAHAVRRPGDGRRGPARRGAAGRGARHGRGVPAPVRFPASSRRSPGPTLLGPGSTAAPVSASRSFERWPRRTEEPSRPRTRPAGAPPSRSRSRPDPAAGRKVR